MADFWTKVKNIVRPEDEEGIPGGYTDYPEEDERYTPGGFHEEVEEEDPEYGDPKYEEPEYEEPPRQKFRSKPQSSPFSRRERESEPRHSSKYGYAARAVTTEDLIAETPRSFQDAARIAEELMDRKPVIMTLDLTPEDDTRRLVDFLSGVAYALGGKIKRFSSKVYILTPPNINLVGDSVDDLESESVYL